MIETLIGKKVAIAFQSTTDQIPGKIVAFDGEFIKVEVNDSGIGFAYVNIKHVEAILTYSEETNGKS